jgi:hypothetical protein
MKTAPAVFSTAAAVTFAAGIALAGPGLRVPAEVRLRKESGPAREAGKPVARKGRAPQDPTLANPLFARALTSIQPGV